MFLCCFGDKCCVIPTQRPGRTCPVTAQPHNENMKEQQAAQFSLSDFIGPQEAFHIARVNISSPGDLSIHTHDYAETFWVESGTGIHHVNGYRMKLQRGDLVMMRPEDVHTFTSVRGTLTIVNVAFHRATLDHYRRRYFEGCRTLFWTTDALPCRFSLTDEALADITTRVEKVMKGNRTIVQLDSLMTDIFCAVTGEPSGTGHDLAPQWLANAMKLFRRPEHFCRGCEGFVQLTGHNGDYVSRVMRRCCGRPLVAFVNEVRMEYAASQLIMTNMPIKEICGKCGFGSMSYFYNVFAKTYRMSPYRFRERNQKIV